MSTECYIPLCERIRDHCRQNEWYGPDCDMYRAVRAYDQQGTLLSRKRTHDPRTGFEFPPATEEQLRLTETVMGFPLPLLLRALYLHVANGGFGPGSGITGAFGGSCHGVGRDVRYRLMQGERFLKEYGQQMYDEMATFFEEGSLDLEQCEQRYGDPKFIRLGPGVWPTHFLHLCDWGCGINSYLHGKSGHVYHVSPGDSSVTLDGEMGFTLLWRQTNTLEEWIECWLQGEEEPWNDELKAEATKASQREAMYPEPDGESSDEYEMWFRQGLQE